MGNRPRITTKSIEKLKAGDVIRCYFGGLPTVHTTIILNDEKDKNGHRECIPICNFTGSEVESGDHSIDVSHYQFPDEWFEEKKQNTWLRCNHIDCVDACDANRMSKLGNIKEDMPDLWEEVCKLTHNCPIAPRLEEACACSYEEIREQIVKGVVPMEDCNCIK